MSTGAYRCRRATLLALANFEFALAIFGFVALFYVALPILREYLESSAGGVSPSLAPGDAGTAETDGRDLGEDA